MRGWVWFLALIACAATGCISNSMGQLPGTVPRGELSRGIGFSYVQAEPVRGAGLPIELSFRYGVHERIDVGLKLSTFAVELEPKVQILRGDSNLSLAVGIGAQVDPDSDGMRDPETEDGMYFVRGRVLAGPHFDFVDLVFSVGSLLAFRGGDVDDTSEWSDRAVALGGGLGIALGAEDHVMFELGAMRVVTGSSPAGDMLDAGTNLVQVTLSFLLGGGGTEQPKAPPSPER